MSYNIHKGEYPAVNYVGMLKVISLEKNKSKIVWTATLQRKDPSPRPKEGEDDKTAIFVTKKIRKS